MVAQTSVTGQVAKGEVSVDDFSWYWYNWYILQFSVRRAYSRAGLGVSAKRRRLVSSLAPPNYTTTFFLALSAASGIEAPMAKRSWAEHAGSTLHLGRACLSGLWKLEARLKGVSVGRGVIFFGRPLISMAKGSRFELRDNAKIGSSLRANPLGCFQPSVLRTMCPGAELVLETSVGISGCVLCAAKSIIIGQGTNIGSGAMVIDNDFHVPSGDYNWADGCAATAREIRIGRGVFIGARAIVLKGVTIGDRAVVGAGAVVTKPVPSRHIAVGNPARIFPISNGNLKTKMENGCDVTPDK